MATVSNKHIQNLAQDFNEPLWSGQLSSNSDPQNINRRSTHQRNSMWDPLVYHSPFATATDTSSDLVKGITGTTIGRKLHNDSNLTSKTTTKELPTVHVKGCGRRKYHPDNAKIKITIKNRLMRGYENNNKREPLECFKITSLSNKSNK